MQKKGTIMANSLKNKLCILGLSAGTIASSLALFGCSKRDLVLAQQNIDTAVVELLSSDKIDSETKYTSFTFLGADVENVESEKTSNLCSVDINGVAISKDKKRAYTTFNYVVDSAYFPVLSGTDKYKDNASLVNSLSNIIKNENLASYSILNVGSVKDLNTNLAKVTSVGLSDEYKCGGNFLYAVNNLNFNENEHYASFSTKELIKFAKTKVNYWAFTENGPIFTIDADRKDYFVNQNVYVELTPDEIALAKTDSSIVFNKFAQYVSGENSQNYAIEQTGVSEAQEQGIVMNEEVSLSNM